MQLKAGNPDFNFAALTDAEAIPLRKSALYAKGFFVPPSELFENVYKNMFDYEDVGITLKDIFKNIESSTEDLNSKTKLCGLFEDIDLTTGKLGANIAQRNKTLIQILQSINDLEFGEFEDSSIDILGDVYEYLAQIYVSYNINLGGEFFTPPEVSELLTRITTVGKANVRSVYDPTCGAGALLAKFVDIVGKNNISDGVYGQEISRTTHNLCRINMILHNMHYGKFNIAHGDTLTNPKHEDEALFEAIVSNPPYSTVWKGNACPILTADERFAPAGTLAPKSRADLAFVMHAVSRLAEDGVAAIVCFPGILYRIGAEQKIRRYLIENNLVDAVIQLPTNMFLCTTVQTCILVLKKNKVDNKILFINSSCDFATEAAKNKLINIDKILKCYIDRQSQEYISKIVEYDEVATKDYTLNIPQYVKPKDTSEVIDIVELNAQIAQIVKCNEQLRLQIDASISELGTI
jgi:type I restriction enzyme M protein